MNANVQRPALSFRISQEYFENNLSDPNNDFTFENGFYERTVDEADLEFSFEDENDRKSGLRYFTHKLLNFQKFN